MTALFDPFKLKDVTLKNRIVVAPMCQYSADDGRITDWQSRASGLSRHRRGRADHRRGDRGVAGRAHHAGRHRHLVRRPRRAMGARHALPQIARRRAGHPDRPCRPQGLGQPPLGRRRPHEAGRSARLEPIGPSALAFGGNLPRVPHEMTRDEIVRVRIDFAAAARRAAAAGFEWLELHFAHGYLAQSFFSPIANKRTDKYGGSFENRSRFLLETFAAVRECGRRTCRSQPNSASPISCRRARRSRNRSNSSAASKRWASICRCLHRLQHARHVGRALGLRLHGALRGALQEGGRHRGRRRLVHLRAETGDAVVRDGKADLVMLAHSMLDDPQWPYHAAKTLEVPDYKWTLPAPYAHWIRA